MSALESQIGRKQQIRFDRKSDGMSIEKIHVPGLSEAIAERGVPLTVAIKANGFVFVSGLPPIDPVTGKMVNATLEVQLRRSIDNLRLALQGAGTSLDKVVMVTLYIANSGYFEQVNRIYREYFPDMPPARTCIAVGSWPFEADVEIEAIAVANVDSS